MQVCRVRSIQTGFGTFRASRKTSCLPVLGDAGGLAGGHLKQTFHFPFSFLPVLLYMVYIYYIYICIFGLFFFK